MQKFQDTHHSTPYWLLKTSYFIQRTELMDWTCGLDLGTSMCGQEEHGNCKIYNDSFKYPSTIGLIQKTIVPYQLVRIQVNMFALLSGML